LTTGGTFDSGATPILATVGGPIGVASAAVSPALIAGGVVATGHGIVLHKNYDKLSKLDKPDLHVEKTINNNVKITGYTKHGLNQAIGRDDGKGVNAKSMLDAIKNPKKIITNQNGTFQYIGKKATVVLNKQGKVVTAWDKPRKIK